MKDVKENLTTVILVFTIIVIISVLGFVCWKIISKEENRENLNIQESYKVTNELIENISNKNVLISENEKENSVEEEVVVPENIGEMFGDTNIRNVIKYIDNGIVKTQINENSNNNATKSKIVYNYNFNKYKLEFICPREWISGSRTLREDDITLVECYKYQRDTNVIRAIIGEISINNYSEMNYSTGLKILESKIKEYVQEAGRVYKVSNFNIEKITKENKECDVLTYDYIEGKMVKHCYSMIEIGYPHIYVLTIEIPEKIYNNDAIEMKENILKTYKIHNAN